MPDASANSTAGNGNILLGFDFGLKQIGVSVGETLTDTARPLVILKAKAGVPQWDQIKALLTQWKPDYLVVGLPLNMDGSESEFCARARKFAARLHGRFGLSVELQDERLSSKEARSILHSEKKVAHDKIDAHAAVVILQSWMQQNKTAG